MVVGRTLNCHEIQRPPIPLRVAVELADRDEAPKCSTLRIYIDKKYTSSFVSPRVPRVPPLLSIFYEPATSFSKTTLALNKTSVRRPPPCPPHTLFLTPTSVVPATLSRLPGVEVLSASNSLVIVASSNTACGVSDRRDMSLDVISTINTDFKRSASRSMVSIPLNATVFTKSTECRMDENDPVIQRTSATCCTIEAERGCGWER